MYLKDSLFLATPNLRNTWASRHPSDIKTELDSAEISRRVSSEVNDLFIKYTSQAQKKLDSKVCGM